MLTRRRRTRRGGFTLLETTVSLALFASLGYSLALVLGVGNKSQKTVIQVAAEDRSLRSSVAVLLDELRASRDSSVSIQALADGNHRLRFMLPIVTGANVAWGVHDPTLSSDPTLQDKPGWCVQYTVRDVIGTDGKTVKQFVRQVLDDTFAVQRERVLAQGLRSGNQVPPGFSVVKNGSVWEISLTTQGLAKNKKVLGVVFHVRTRNA